MLILSSLLLQLQEVARATGKKKFLIEKKKKKVVEEEEEKKEGANFTNI
jgi:hypothetical protein